MMLVNCHEGFLDSLTHIKPHFDRVMLINLISKQKLHCHSVTFNGSDLLTLNFQHGVIAIQLESCPPPFDGQKFMGWKLIWVTFLYFSIFPPQPFKLNGYHRTTPGLWTVGSCYQMLQKLCNTMVICPFAPYELVHGTKTFQIWYHWGLDFVEPISLKLQDAFIPFEIWWNCHEL